MALMLILIFAGWIVVPAWGNSYVLFGQGNCVKLTYDAMEKYWPVVPDIPGDWDAYRWVGLIGQEIDGYRIERVAEPGPGDVLILGRSKLYPRGHVGMVTGIWWSCDLERGRKQTNYTILESNMYATAKEYPLMFEGCRYRVQDYPANYLAQATYIRCSKIKPASSR